VNDGRTNRIIRPCLKKERRTYLRPRGTKGVTHGIGRVTTAEANKRGGPSSSVA